MRIAYVCHYFVPEPAAPAARVHELSRAWVAAGHQVSVITAFPNHPTGQVAPAYRGRLWASECLDGIRVLRCWLYAVPNRGVGRRGLNHLSFMVSALLLGLPRLQPVDVVIASSPTLFSAVSAWLMARARRVPFVLEVRDLWPDVFADVGVMREGIGVRALRRLAAFLYRQADEIVVVTRAFAERLAAQGVPPDKVVCIPNGADVSLFGLSANGSAARQAMGIPETAFVAAYIGSHGLSHGLSAVLDAAALDPDTTYLLVGDGADRERLVAERERRGLKNVMMRPSVPKREVPGLYAAADVCLVPLRDVPIFDSFVPSKLFEILAAGRPIVGALRGEARAILVRSGGAMLVEPENGEAMAEAVQALRADPGQRQRLAERGRAFVVAEYDRNSLADAYLRTLHGVVERQV